MLVLVYTCQNATLLEMTLHGSYRRGLDEIVSLSSTFTAPKTYFTYPFHSSKLSHT